jgi:hypothetical protein
MRLLGFLVIAIVIAVIGYIIKVITKGRMMNSLGRDVGDHELTSLNSWMEVHEKEGQNKPPQNNPPA